MADNGFSKEDFEKLKQVMSDIADLQKKINKGGSDYKQTIKDIQAAFRELKNLQQQISIAEKTSKDIREQINKALSKEKTLSGKKKFLISDEGKELRKQLKIHDEIVKILSKEEATLSKITKELAEQVNSANTLGDAFNRIGTGVIGIGKTLLNVGKELLGQVKSVRQTELSMGILSKQAEAFRGNIYKTSLLTNQLGIDAGELAKMQGTYSEGIGRSVQLTQQGLEAMAELAAGTTLGADGAAELATQMDNFNISVLGTKNIVEEMLNTASAMGINASKVTKTLQQSLKLAQRYHFKDGVKGLTRMAAAAAKMKLDLEGISGLADKVFRPEGAIEMAAQLQVMGGEFSKLADPFQLMFKARNDFEGFAKDIGKATKEFVQFNKETGEFDVTGLGLDRMREISNITGIAVDKLQEMGVQAKKTEAITSQMGIGFDDEDRSLISSLAEFNKSNGQWEINAGDFKGAVKDLTKQDIKRIKEEDKSLKERAKQAQTFDKKWTNIINTLKSTLLPFIEELDKVLGPALNNFTKWMHENKVPERLAEFAKEAGKLAGGLIKFIVDNPITSLVTAIGAMGLFKYMQWYANGIALGEGFLTVAGAGMGGGGFNDMMGGGRGRKGRPVGGNVRDRYARRFGNNAANKRFGGRGGFMGKFGKLGRFGGGILGSLGFGLGSMGLDSWRGSLTDPEGGFGKTLGVGSSALEGAGWGSWFGLPGMALGALIGTGHGLMSELGGYDAIAQGMFGASSAQSSGSGYGESNTKFNDFVMRPGQAAVPFSESDTLVGMKSGGPLEKAIKEETSGGGGEQKITFGELKINGVIKLDVNGKNVDLPLDDPMFVRELSQLIQLELRKSIGGGKINPNPKN